MPLKIIWTLTGKDGNTGMDGGYTSVMIRAFNNEDVTTSCVQEQTSPDLKTLLDWCKNHNFVPQPTTLLEAVGIKAMCYAQPYQASKEHTGKNNIMATFFTKLKENGLALDTILGRAVFIRLDPDNEDQPVDFTRDEFMRLAFLINDIGDIYGGDDDIPEALSKIRKCMPYYNAQLGDTMTAGGFSGNDGRYCFVKDDGSLDKSEGVEIQASYIIPKAAT